jgi:outer membrane protein assembly factor BamD (BamD/ComL family)
MMTIQILLLNLTLLFCPLLMFAQQTAYFEDIEEEIQIAKELFEQGKYNSAYRQFEKIQENADPGSEIYSEASFYKSVSALKAGHGSGYKMTEKFIEDYPESPYINRAWFDLADYQFEKGHYPAVLRSYSQVELSALDDMEQVK